MNKIMDFIKSKKGIALILIIFIIAGVIGVFTLSESRDSNKTKDKDIKIAKEKESKAKKELANEEAKKKEAEKELEEAKKSGNTDAIKKAEQKLEASKKAVETKKQSVAKASTEIGKSTNTTPKVEPKSESPKPSTPSATTPKKKERVWVVDKPAWTEEVREPIYVPTWWVSYQNSNEVRIFYNKAEWNKYLDNSNDPIARWGTGENVPDPSGATRIIDTIHHKEEGHWEER